MSGILVHVDHAEPVGPLAPLSRLCLIGACVCLVLMALVQLWQIFGRFVLNDAPSWTEPVSIISLNLTVMLGAAVCVRHETHLKFDMLGNALPPFWRMWLRRFNLGLIALFGGILLVFGFQLMIDGWGFAMPGVPLPAGLHYGPFVLGGALFILFALERIILSFAPEA